MFVAIVRATVNPEHTADVEEVLAAQAKAMAGVDGLIDFVVLRPVADGAPHLNYTSWESRQHFLDFQASSQARDVAAASDIELADDAYLGRPLLDEYESFGN